MLVKVESTPMLLGLPSVHGKPIVARFDVASMSSDGGLLALREVEQRLGIASRLAACISDPRAPERIRHELDEIIRIRMLMIAAGYKSLPSGRRSRTRGTATTPTACAATRCSSWRWVACPMMPICARSPPSRA